MGVIATDLEVLRACEGVASRRGSAPTAAFVTWLVVQREGLQAARARVSHGAWYRHLALLRKAGIELAKHGRPAGAASSSRTALTAFAGKRVRLLRSFDRWHPAGTTGTVRQVVYRDGGWLVGVQFDGSPGSYEELTVERFARLVEWVWDDAA